MSESPLAPLGQAQTMPAAVPSLDVNAGTTDPLSTLDTYPYLAGPDADPGNMNPFMANPQTD